MEIEPTLQSTDILQLSFLIRTITKGQSERAKFTLVSRAIAWILRHQNYVNLSTKRIRESTLL